MLEPWSKDPCKGALSKKPKHILFFFPLYLFAPGPRGGLKFNTLETQIILTLLSSSRGCHSLSATDSIRLALGYSIQEMSSMVSCSLPKVMNCTKHNCYILSPCCEPFRGS